MRTRGHPARPAAQVAQDRQDREQPAQDLAALGDPGDGLDPQRVERPAERDEDAEPRGGAARARPSRRPWPAFAASSNTHAANAAKAIAVSAWRMMFVRWYPSGFIPQIT